MVHKVKVITSRTIEQEMSVRRGRTAHREAFGLVASLTAFVCGSAHPNNTDDRLKQFFEEGSYRNLNLTRWYAHNSHLVITISHERLQCIRVKAQWMNGKNTKPNAELVALFDDHSLLNLAESARDIAA